MNFVAGLPALGIEPLDPFNIPEIKILQGGDGPVALNASLVNVTLRGLTSTKILSNKWVPATQQGNGNPEDCERIKKSAQFAIVRDILAGTLLGRHLENRESDLRDGILC